MNLKIIVKLLSEFKQYTSTVDGMEFNLENFYVWCVEQMIQDNK